MEKKIYMQPATHVVKAQAAQFLTTSTNVHSNGDWGINNGGYATGDEDID